MDKETGEKRGPAKGRSKLSDVAQLAGVSSSTVSFVLGGKAEAYRISDETVRRVREAASDLRYAPSLLHRSVRRGRTHILSFFNSFRNREESDLYMDRLSVAIEHAGGRHGYNVLIHCRFEKTVQETYEFLNGGFADGLILFAPAPNEPLLPLLRESGLPTVIVNPRGEEEALSTVEDDVEHGMGLVAETLFGNGHRRVGIVTQEAAGWPDPQRRESKLRANLRRLGLPDERIRTVPQVRSGPEEIARVLRETLAEPNRPSALFVWNDRTAYEILEACQLMGIRVPEELSIVGYDGIVWPSASGLAVTSVRAPFEGIADAAVHVLDRLIQGEAGPIHDKVPGSLVLGDTVQKREANPHP